MHFGEVLEETAYIDSIRHAYTAGIRTFVTADVYGGGRADEMLGEALAGLPRSSYCLVGAVGHDFYKGLREGSKGYPRFTDPALHSPSGYQSFLTMATEKSLERCRVDAFDCLLLHNPDERGYTSDAVWDALRSLKEQGLTAQLGIAPGPANGFSYDLIRCFELFEEVMDWSMLILNPLEPWPGTLVLPAAQEYNVKVLTRVVDYGGLFFDDMKADHHFRPGDHRSFRPAGWVEHGLEKIHRMRHLAEKYQLTLSQFACAWNLAQQPVKCVVPTFIQEAGTGVKSIHDKIDEIAALPVTSPFSADEVEEVRTLGDNTGCMTLKGASRRHTESDRPDEWAMRPELEPLAERWQLSSIH